MFTYNFRRLLNLIGITLFKKLLKAIKSGNIEAIKAEILAYIALFLHIWSNYCKTVGFYDFRGEKLSI